MKVIIPCGIMTRGFYLQTRGVSGSLCFNNMNNISIAEREIGRYSPCFIVAEMGLAHDGKISAAHSFIDSASEAGADAVKFQTHIAEAEGTARERFRVEGVFRDATRQDYWRRTAFSKEQWIELKQHADEKKIMFLSSPFSGEAMDLLLEVGVSAWKVASGETNNIPLIRKLIGTGLPMLVSTGMSTIAEIERTVKMIKDAGSPLVLFQCTNRYPCPPEHLGLNMIREYMHRFEVPAGFSDHSGRTASGIAAYCMGACAVEVHAVFRRDDPGPDTSSSLTFEELAQLVDSIRFLERAKESYVDKDREAEELREIREHFTKSIVAAVDLAAGTELKPEHLAFKKPGTGIPAGDVDNVTGCILSRDINKDDILDYDCLER